MSNRIRYITVPKNNDGIEEYEYGVEGSENLIETQLPDSEFKRLAEEGVFRELNSMFDLLIDDYESEIISADRLKEYLSYKSLKNGTFFHAVEEAIEYNTFVALDF